MRLIEAVLVLVPGVVLFAVFLNPQAEEHESLN